MNSLEIVPVVPLEIVPVVPKLFVPKSIMKMLFHMKFELEMVEEVMCQFKSLDDLIEKYKETCSWNDYNLYIRLIKNKYLVLPLLTHTHLTETNECVYIHRKMSGYEKKKKKFFLQKCKSTIDLHFLVKNYFNPIEKWFYLSFPDSILDSSYSLLMNSIELDKEDY